MVATLYFGRALMGAGVGLCFDLARSHTDMAYNPRIYATEMVKSALTAIALTVIGMTFGTAAMVGAFAGTLLLPILGHTWSHNSPYAGLGADHPGDLLIWRIIGFVVGAVAGRYLLKI